MGKIVSACAYANNEVAYVAWNLDGKIEGCLGFEVTRVYLNADGSVALRADGSEDRVRCASWVGFSGQRNPHWLPQDTGIWPVQKLEWRDLTVRKRRDGLQRRPAEVFVRYEIRPLGDLEPGMPAAPDPTPKSVQVVQRDASGRPVKDGNGHPVKVAVKAYEGKPRPLGYLGPAVPTEPVRVTSHRSVFRSTFTNGILAAQWLRNVLMEDGQISPNELFEKISNPADPHRKYLAGDVLPLLHELFGRPGTFHLALYELDDKELVDLLLANAARIHVILANTGLEDGKWDGRNAKARQALIDAGADIQHRMFNNATHIGHNKFVVHDPADGGARSVFTGSTNWTSTGVAGQSNNALLIEDDAVAQLFMDYWERMKADALAVPNPFSSPMSKNQQSLEFRRSNEASASVGLANGARIELWYSPNMQQRTKGKKTPPDLQEVYRRMRLAREAILFLAFYPAQSGKDCIIGEAIDIGRKDGKLIVTGAVSSAQAMPNYVAAKKNDPDDDSDDEAAESPRTFFENNVSIVRASRVDDRALLADFGAEQLTAKGGIGAIIHDKVVVIDPLSPECTVILGSHNLGFKASYCNDENMVIVSGDQALAEAYAVHILDVYDHYRFRAVQAERQEKHQKGWSGFLDSDDSWLEAYAEGEKGALMRYFARGRPN
ncbi:phosphatidylserine/phosphatidylglycerophosphate/cardiolipin synthase-like enzyme [Pelomonas saccharophila]|uniref:phospholipase D n=1 Tax=Roseateles saccharophilus TaxID=304 RepID=A0ABU1YIQ0_ROSSA|nr:phospholipase D-like domain-containing protein [Roseateles saccharophilus]MDR7268130.1 phosphatidylserine/phosphatidylglycerophosphate/cardiolipin synthase-like enzyme [Roseateles saccharophilus]